MMNSSHHTCVNAVKAKNAAVQRRNRTGGLMSAEKVL